MGPAMLLHGNIKSHVDEPRKALTNKYQSNSVLSIEII